MYLRLASLRLLRKCLAKKQVVPIIEIPGYGSTSAKLMCEKLKIKSCKEADKLKKAKEEVPFAFFGVPCSVLTTHVCCVWNRCPSSTSCFFRLGGLVRCSIVFSLGCFT